MKTKLRDHYPRLEDIIVRQTINALSYSPKPYHNTLLLVIGLSGVQFGLKSQFIISEKKERHEVQLLPLLHNFESTKFSQ